MQNSSPHLLVYITCDSTDNAREIATSLVNERLAACVNILPAIESIYRWQNKIESSNEVLLMVKTHRDIFTILRERVCKLHHYELPEIIAVPIEAGLEPYLNWITESVNHHE
ncbi:MAG: divalent-cation tolerance protein CutA [Gammaproteobacteria bacterium]